MGDLLAKPNDRLRPLAERMRPRNLDAMVGQRRLLGKGQPFRRAVESGQLYSMILWGPPGCGKTTLSLLLAHYADAHFEALSAVLSNLNQVRTVLEQARQRLVRGQKTILFVDEVHRFNRAQQDAFLPDIERGSIIFVGATTQNPSFELNSALLSRCRVHVLDSVSDEEIAQALNQALNDPIHGLGNLSLSIDASQLLVIAQASDGDVRRSLTLLEIIAELAQADGGAVTQELVHQVLADRTRRFDRRGEQFYDQISVLHKSVRGTNPDAALYWLVRMLDGGCDPIYLARRLTRMAIEDIGLADPRALQMALNAWDAYTRLGSPEGELALAQLVLYLASTAKSNATYLAHKLAQKDVVRTGTLPVPIHLRNAPTAMMKSLNYGKGYQYDHDFPEGIAPDQTAFPEELGEQEYYSPVERGLEIKLKQKLDAIRMARRRKKPSPTTD